MTDRIFHLNDLLRSDQDQLQRVEISRSGQANVIGWCALPGQRIAPHRHPDGQDTWLVVSGQADYLMEGDEVRRLGVGDIAIAAPGQVHGACVVGSEPFTFVSVVSPAAAGFEKADG